MSRVERETFVRPDTGEYFLNIADVVATRGTCPRLQVGSVLVKDKMIISTGYNGAPRGLEHCLDVGCKMVNGHCVRAVHSEVNTITQAARYGTKTEGATLYTNFLPCEGCTTVIINAGVIRVVFREIYKNLDLPYVRELFEKAKVELVQRSIK